MNTSTPDTPVVLPSVAGWLREVDPTGGLDAYREAFEENYDDAKQIKRLFHVRMEDGRTTCAPSSSREMASCVLLTGRS